MITNTTKQMQENPERGLIMAVPGAIEASERRGQQEVLHSDRLPSRSGGDDAALIALGFTFGEPDREDPLFRPATLPTGWKREGSSNAMWSYIVDERGIRRVSVGYKAAFYDRWARMLLINVGSSVADDAIYGGAMPTSEALRLDRLTDDERVEFVQSVDRMRSKIAETPDIYGKYADRRRGLRRRFSLRADAMPTKTELVEVRQARGPLPYHPSLTTFHCFCQRQLTPSAEIVHCKCGRTWKQREDA